MPADSQDSQRQLAVLLAYSRRQGAVALGISVHRGRKDSHY
jgi:hypothetical protein